MSSSAVLLLLVFVGGCACGPRGRSAWQCGVSLSQGKIIGGVDSGGYRYPWFALLLLKKNSFLPVPVCAGSLISSIHVLSAAHCFTISASVQYEKLFTVALGVYDICSDREATRQIFNAAHVAVHEKYRKTAKFYDIALIKLDRPANFVPICLPLAGVPDVTELALIVGFGVTEENSSLTPCHMLEVNVTKFSRADCSTSRLPLEEKKEPTIICAGALSGAADSCYGDSGGPLQTTTPDGRYVVAGIVSYGYGCGTPNVPGVYTNVGSYVEWIENKMAALGSKGSAVSNRPKASVTFPRQSNSDLPGDQKDVVTPTSSSRAFWREENRREHVAGPKSKVKFPE